MNTICNSCPRKCGVDREHTGGYCKVKNDFSIALFSLNRFEEPVISGERGSGTVFFNGCNLKCCYCQNYGISHCLNPNKYTEDGEFIDKLYALQEAGAHNVNLVTPTHYAGRLARVLKMAKEKLSIPFVYNTGGYDSVETLKSLEGLIDVYLPDSKYFSSQISKRYSDCADYFSVNIAAITEMERQRPKIRLENGLMKEGVLVRHLILPGLYKDSLTLIDELNAHLPYLYLSLMSQYTPQFNRGGKELDRRLTSYEYDKVLQRVRALKIDGFMQDRLSADTRYTPDFK